MWVVLVSRPHIAPKFVSKSESVRMQFAIVVVHC